VFFKASWSDISDGPAFMGPLAVDELVRGAASLFWMRQPWQRESVAAVETEFRVILEEVLEDVRRGPERLNPQVESSPEAPSEEDFFGPVRVRQMMRQAAFTCFCMLPPARSKPEVVEAELRRIVDRMFREDREDAEAFSLGR